MSCGWVPAWQTIYSDYIVLVGSIGWNITCGKKYGGACNSAPEDITSARLLLAHQLSDGVVMGGDAMGYYTAAHFFTNGTSDTNASNAVEARYLQNLTSTRLEYSQYLVLGRLVRPPRLVSASLPKASMCMYWGGTKCCDVERPAMQLWLDETTRTLALVAVNADPLPLTFSAEVDVVEVFIDSDSQSTGLSGVHPDEYDERNVVATTCRSGVEWVVKVQPTGHSGAAYSALLENLTIPALSAIVVELRAADI